MKNQQAGIPPNIPKGQVMDPLGYPDDSKDCIYFPWKQGETQKQTFVVMSLTSQYHSRKVLSYFGAAYLYP